MPHHLLALDDGSDGHRAQALGLARAIARRTGATVLDYHPGGQAALPAPADLGAVISAGRHVAATALGLARAAGCPSIAVMNPGWLQRRRFDLVVVPAHDGLAPSSRVLVSDGALTCIPPGRNQTDDRQLILIGGHSRHHGWDDATLFLQLDQVVARYPSSRFGLTTSRRTPPATAAALAAWSRRHPCLDFQPWPHTPPGWLAAGFDTSARVWVTADSVSMVYEALSAGARLGLLQVPLRRPRHRVARLMDGLIARRTAAWASTVVDGTDLPPPAHPLQEADRIAAAIIECLPGLARGIAP